MAKIAIIGHCRPEPARAMAVLLQGSGHTVSTISDTDLAAMRQGIDMMGLDVTEAYEDTRRGRRRAQRKRDRSW